MNTSFKICLSFTIISICGEAEATRFECAAGDLTRTISVERQHQRPGALVDPCGRKRRRAARRRWRGHAAGARRDGAAVAGRDGAVAGLGLKFVYLQA